MMRWFLRAAMAVAALGTSCTSALAEVLIECGASKGYSYFFEGVLVNSEDSGWHEDGLSDGQLFLVRDGENYDIWYTDAMGSRSATADGGKVILLAANEPVFALVVLYPGVLLETYQFDLASKGGEVVWSQSKFNAPINKVAAYRAGCSRKQ